MKKWALIILVGLPILGLWGLGRLGPEEIAPYLEFPPLTRHVPHAPFSAWVFLGLAAFIVLGILPFVIAMVRGRHSEEVPTERGTNRPFPWWGWCGLAFTLGAWIMAWTRFPWFAGFQAFTFSPLWVGYIVVVNAVTAWRSGRCMLVDRPRQLLGLALLSAGFWWYFEYLNRFVQNWYYVGVANLSAFQYFLYATLPFATVLPAVMGTFELLQTFPRLSAGLKHFRPLRIMHPKGVAAVTLLLFGFALAGIGVWPDLLFPVLWLAPLGILTCLRVLRGKPTIFASLAQGDWRSVILLALAALICGFFWEMWNFASLAKWIYAIPFVNAVHLFEMPMLGYVGYLPFGLECAVIAAEFFPEHQPESRATGPQPVSSSRLGRVSGTVNAALLILVAVFIFWAPAGLLVNNLRDPAWHTGAVPELAWNLHRNLAPRYAQWARERVASGRAAHLALRDVPSTEWPIFGSVYFLWATEKLQQEWEKDPSHSTVAPRVYAREAIEAAADLLMDPVHHTWVQTHWGTNYLHRENVFFRSLLIAGMTVRQNLLQDDRHLDQLRDQVETLAAELDASRLGILNDYPDECYPIDVFAAWVCIQRADRVLGTDHSRFLARARRGFEGQMLDGAGMVPFVSDPDSGEQYQPSRGTGNSWVLLLAPELWPDKAADWYARYETHFWQDLGWAAGFREFSRELKNPEYEWGYDVDSGPILAGFSAAANAFGMAAARVNGRMDQAWILSSQVLAATWPLPNGQLLGPRILSSSGHAPYLGEACLLYLMVQTPAAGVPVVQGGHVPRCVYYGLAFYLVGGLLLLGLAVWIVLRAWRGQTPVVGFGFVTWGILLATGFGLVLTGRVVMAAAVLVMMLVAPRIRKWV